MAVLVWLGAIFLLAFSLTPYIPKSTPATDLPSHFMLQLAVGAFVLLVLAVMLKVPGKVHFVLLAAYFLCLFQLIPLMTFARPVKAEGAALKLLQANVLAGNRETAAFKKLVEAENPDIIVVDEANSAFAALFAEMKDSYPHQRVIPMDNSSFGIAALSKLPFESIEEKHLALPGIPSIFFTVKTGGKTIHVAALHAANPLRDFKPRDDEFTALAKWQAETKPENLIVTGDLNATPYCPALKSATRRMGLANARKGRGILGSWPSDFPFFMRLPIDHVLVSRGLKVADFRLGPDIGSDHLPTISVITLHYKNK